MPRSKRFALAILFCGLFLPSLNHAVRAGEEEITLISRFVAAPGREADVEARFAKLIPFVRKAEPDVTYRVYRSVKEPTVYIFYEVFPSQAARDAHVNVHIPAFQKEYGSSTEGLFARPPEREFLRAFGN